MLTKRYLLALATFITASGANNSCETGYTICSPPGATNTHTPSIGTPDFENLYVDLLHSSLPPPPSRAATSGGTASLCCNSLLSCLTMSNLALPFCYDKFTNNYYLPDGSSGDLSMGAYVSPTGDSANLATGDFTFSNGTKGNIYSDNEAAKPDTATLPMPTLYTSAGPQPAVPTNALGAIVTLTYTTSLPGTTVDPVTILASTVPAIVGTETDLVQDTLTTTISGSAEVETTIVTSMIPSTTSAKTIAGTTIEGKTIPGTVSTVTTTKVGSPTSSSTSKKSGGVRLRGSCLYAVGFLVAVAAVYFT